MECSLGISNFLEEISSLFHFVVFLYLFALITEEGFLISSFYSLELCIGAQYATGDQWRNNSRKNKGMEPKQKQDWELTMAKIMSSLLPNSELN